MTAATAPNNMAVRSSMELMLEELLGKDDTQKPRYQPPALPARPTSRARLPPSAAARRRPQLGNKLFVTAAGDAEKENRAPADSRPSFGMKKTPKVPSAEDFDSRALQGIICLQKHFRVQRARSAYLELKGGAFALQSFIRGERARNEFKLLLKRRGAAVVIQKHVRSWILRKAFHDRQKSVVLIQSAGRGWLARRRLKLQESWKVNNPQSGGYLENNLQGMEEKCSEQSRLRDSTAELKMRVMKAEAALRQKEEENLTLRQQLEQYEMKRSDYEEKMKAMEESWQKQMSSLQTKLAEAKKSLASNIIIPLQKPDASPNGRYCESEDYTSTDFLTPDATPVKQSYTASPGGVRTSECTLSSVSLLVREFEHRKIVFEDDAGFLVEAKSRQSGYDLNPDEELKNLKVRFAAWKKGFKAKLKETKSALKKLGNAEKKSYRRWWGRKSTSKS